MGQQLENPMYRHAAAFAALLACAALLFVIVPAVALRYIVTGENPSPGAPGGGLRG